jgi:UDP-glucose 4-epimerase
VDLAKAHVVALKRLLNKRILKKVETFNLGTGTGSLCFAGDTSIWKSKWEKLVYKFVDRREGDITAAYANTTSKYDFGMDAAKSSFWGSAGERLKGAKLENKKKTVR